MRLGCEEKKKKKYSLKKWILMKNLCTENFDYILIYLENKF